MCGCIWLNVCIAVTQAAFVVILAGRMVGAASAMCAQGLTS